ncbi:hypothetical protein N7533_003958 [Penicillium manginii]|jgi:hypothetical protein|uniref:uncharacterized protein n=1 Tax=Penicillium manginii TaxID=203109 RepID=UPI002548462E|nr:uncharacterized protein N7533_003958 [Penicillium manginii]KAJ5754415.1 hypothetical protein N7533_003958 [Penicillium manginii]
MAISETPQVTSASPATPRRLLLISVPRTASNLLLKILNIHDQPQFHTSPKGGYFFYPAFVSAAQNGHLAKSPEQWTQDDRQSVKKGFQECLETLEDESSVAQKNNKAMFTKEHAFWFFNPAALHKMRTGCEDPGFFKDLRSEMPQAYGPSSWSPGNETVLSDEYMRSWQYAFIIRHPALAWPSMYRAMVKIAKEGYMDEDGVKGSSLTNMTMHWSRMLYDWCLEQPDVSVAPPVVDAHDLIHSPEIVYKLCEQTGLDKSALQFEWGGKNEQKKSDNWAAPETDADQQQRDLHNRAASIMLSTLEDSKGIVKDKAPVSIDIDAEAAKWKVEFGEEIAQMIEKAVRDSMPDYEYLKARRITV